jgi:hypothetical protein
VNTPYRVELPPGTSGLLVENNISDRRVSIFGPEFPTGYKWQCVEFPTRYYWVVYGLKIRGGHANTWYNNAVAKGLASFPNGGTTEPAIDDILCSASHHYGHVAIVRAVSPNSITVIHQNWDNTSSDNAKILKMDMVNGTYKVNDVGSYSWQGWLRKK